MTVPHPIPGPMIADLDDAPRLRKLHCRFYITCLTVMIGKHLRYVHDLHPRSWNCTACTVEDRLDRDEERADMIGMARMWEASKDVKP